MMEEETEEPKKKKEPNIKKHRKSGPKTFRGKLKVALLSGRIIVGTSSKLMQLASKCGHCPLGEHTQNRTMGKKVVPIVVPAKCKFYNIGRKKCVYPVQEQIKRLKLMFDIEQRYGSLEAQKMMAFQSLMDAEMARKVEIVKDARPGFYTKEFSELASKQMEGYNKMMFGEKQRIEADVNVKVATLDVNELIKEEKDKIIGSGRKFEWEKGHEEKSGEVEE